MIRNVCVTLAAGLLLAGNSAAAMTSRELIGRFEGKYPHECGVIRQFT
jgi:hypothetical protein